jgi:hypothetical protein
MNAGAPAEAGHAFEGHWRNLETDKPGSRAPFISRVAKLAASEEVVEGEAQ